MKSVQSVLGFAWELHHNDWIDSQTLPAPPGDADLLIDGSIRDWVLIPIMLVMVLVGILRHQVTLLMQSTPKITSKGVREAQATTRGRLLCANGSILPASIYEHFKSKLCKAYEDGSLLRNPRPVPVAEGQEAPPPPNPLAEPGGMDAMMDGMKKNLAMIIPQSVIMAWITFFFIKLPFPMTVRFKAMLQRGIDTTDLDVAWVSSLSWYFLNLFGLRSIFNLILGEENAADDMKQMQAMSGVGATPPPGQVDFDKLMQTERENLVLHKHYFELDGVEERVLALLRPNKDEESKKVK